MKAIEVFNLSKHFPMPKRGNAKQRKQQKEKSPKTNRSNGKIKAVDNIAFEVQRGEIFGLLGPNGAGKTTTIRMLTGILKPTNGKITVFNKDLENNLLIIQQIMGHVPEMSNVYVDLTGMQNVELVGELYGIPRKERKPRAESLLSKFDLLQWKNAKAKHYSKGMKQRLLLCMALMSDPVILFLDEPTSGLDVQSSIIIKKLIKEYHRSGMTILLTTHDMDVANELCDRIAIMNNGKITCLDDPETLRRLQQDYHALDVQMTGEINLKELEDLTNINKIENRGKNNYHIIVENIKEGINELIAFIEQKGITLIKLKTYEPELEEVFLKIINGEEVK